MNSKRNTAYNLKHYSARTHKTDAFYYPPRTDARTDVTPVGYATTEGCYFKRNGALAGR